MGAWGACCGCGGSILKTPCAIDFYTSRNTKPNDQPVSVVGAAGNCTTYADSDPAGKTNVSAGVGTHRYPFRTLKESVHMVVLAPAPSMATLMPLFPAAMV